MKMQIKATTTQEMKELRMNHREFAEYLTERMSQEGDSKLSHSTVYNWANYGKPPATDFLEDLLSVYQPSDRRFQFALKLLAVKSPHVWGSGGVIWTLTSVIKPNK